MAKLTQWLRHFNSAWDLAVKTAGRQVRGGGHDAPWWSDECKKAHREWRAADRFLRDTEEAVPYVVPPERLHFLAVVAKAKKLYWRNQLNEVRLPAQLYRVVGWHRGPRNCRAPPIKAGDREITDSKEKAQHIAKGLLERFSQEDDLLEDPLEGWTEVEANLTLTCHQPVSAEEAEARTIGISSTSPGVDGTTVYLLKQCWPRIAKAVTALFDRCLRSSHYPSEWKVAEVALVP